MDGAAEFQIAAETNSEVAESSLQHSNCEQIGQRLCWMLVAAVAGVDHRNPGKLRSNLRSAFLWVAYGTDIGKGRDYADGVGNTFSFCGAAGIRRSKPQHLAAKIHHCRFKAKTCSGARLIKKRRKSFPLAKVSVFLRIFFNVLCNRDQSVNFFDRQIQRIDQMLHAICPFRRKNIGKSYF